MTTARPTARSNGCAPFLIHGCGCSATRTEAPRSRETVGSRDPEASSSRSSNSDDLWTPDKLELQLQALRQPLEAALAYSWTAFVDEHGDFLFAKDASCCEGDVYAELLRHCFVASGSNILVRKSCALAVGGFDIASRRPRIGSSAYELRLAGNSPSFPATNSLPDLGASLFRECAEIRGGHVCTSAIEPSRLAPDRSRSAVRASPT